MLDVVETLLEDFKQILKPDAGFMQSVLSAHEPILMAVADGDPATGLKADVGSHHRCGILN